MIFWATLWSFLTAAGTVSMAVTTYLVIRQGAARRADAERQHQDRFKPVCILMPYNGIDPLAKRGDLLEEKGVAADNPSFGILAIRCALRNVGTGPALNLRIIFRFLDVNGWTTEPWELSPLGAGETRGGIDAPLLIPIRIGDGFNVTDFATIAGKLWEVRLEYQDVFGRRFCTVHHKNAVQMGPPVPVLGSAPGPGRPLMYPPQPWVTFPTTKVR